MGKRRKVERETHEIAAMLRRMVKAHGRRVGAGDPEDLVDLVALHQVLDEAIAAAVAGQVETGFSWTEIGNGLGISRQGARQRFGGVTRTERPAS